MVAELSALQQIVNALTGLDGLPAVIVECAVTTIYTCTPIRCSCPPSSYGNQLTEKSQLSAAFASPS